jgi:hypothetical protein
MITSKKGNRDERFRPLIISDSLAARRLILRGCILLGSKLTRDHNSLRMHRFPVSVS